VQTDAAINPGTAAGPVIDLPRDCWHQLAKMAFTPQGIPTQGLGFAIRPKSCATALLNSRKLRRNIRVEKTARTE